MKIIESDDGMYATVVLEDADAEEMDEEFVKEFIRVAESQKQFKWYSCPDGGMADTADLKSASIRCEGSNPFPGTISPASLCCRSRGTSRWLIKKRQKPVFVSDMFLNSSERHDWYFAVNRKARIREKMTTQ